MKYKRAIQHSIEKWELIRIAREKKKKKKRVNTKKKAYYQFKSVKLGERKKKEIVEKM